MEIVGLDHGYAAMKTAHFVFPSGVVDYGEQEPYTDVYKRQIEQFTAGSENQLHVQLGSLVIGCDALLKQGCLLAVNRSCRVFSSGAAFLYGRKIICIRHDSTSCFYYTT